MAYYVIKVNENEYYINSYWFIDKHEILTNQSKYYILIKKYKSLKSAKSRINRLIEIYGNEYKFNVEEIIVDYTE